MMTNDAYFKVERLIHAAIRKYQNQYGGNYDDLQSVCHELYVKACRTYNEQKKVPWGWWLYRALWHGLRHRRFNDLPLSMLLPISGKAEKLLANRTFNLQRLLDEVSHEAATVIRLVIEPPLEIVYSSSPNRSPKRYRRTLIKFLKNAGWEAVQVMKVFREIAEALK